jgi:hypothetical protein
MMLYNSNSSSESELCDKISTITRVHRLQVGPRCPKAQHWLHFWEAEWSSEYWACFQLKWTAPIPGNEIDIRSFKSSLTNAPIRSDSPTPMLVAKLNLMLCLGLFYAFRTMFQCLSHFGDKTQETLNQRPEHRIRRGRADGVKNFEWAVFERSIYKT